MVQPEKSQNNAFISWNGALAESLSLLSLKGHEAVCKPFIYEMYSEARLNKSQLEALFRQPVSCRMGNQLDNLPQRYVHGVITRINQQWLTPNHALCTFTVEPALALLSLGKSTRIWQNITTLDVVRTLLSEHKITQVSTNLRRTYTKREYCIQYRESNLDFISRLLEEEGIYYFFTHQEDKHTLVLADHPTGHPISTTPSLYWHYQGKDNVAESIWQWSSSSVVIPSMAAFSGYNIHQAISVSDQQDSQNSPYVIPAVSYNDITPFEDKTKLCQATKAIVETWETNITSYQAVTNAHWLACGEVFNLLGHHSDNDSYRIQEFNIETGNNTAGTKGEYSCQLRLLRNSTQWRPICTHEPPIIADVLTATVVGPASEEIHTDDLGRVKIRFPWDKHSPDGDAGSCWVRVNQPWTGNQLGAQFLPRVGNEVLVMINLGQPVIIGSLYNGQNKPPFPLPANKTESGFLSRHIGSDKDSPAGHRLSFNDTKDAEKLTITAAKDLLLTVKNEHISQIGTNRNTQVTEGDDTLTLKNGNLLVALEQGNLHQNITGNMTTNLKNGSYSLSIKGGSGAISSDAKFNIESSDSISFTVGKSSITLSPTGVDISGLSITISSKSELTMAGQLIRIG